MTLKEYRRKRDFTKTAEPRSSTTKKGWLYVIQKHAASHLHYDFRLQLGNVLLSWAVPKGPSLDPSQKRLAVHVEDHPVDYGGFEGTIPEGEYGGGTVMLWDRGHWAPAGEAEGGGEKAARKAYEQGRLKFTLYGKKLRGNWMLVRRGGGKDRDERNWFLFKERDNEARDADEYDITTEEPLSVKTGRDLDDIASRSKKVWHSNKDAKKVTKTTKKKSAVAKSTARPKARAKRKTTKRGRSAKADDVSGARRGRLPRFVKPQLATLTDEPPEGTEWLHEMKFDGYRMLCRVDSGDVKFISRNEQEWTSKFSPLVAEAKTLPVTTALFDGEVVIVQPDGTTSFQALQQYFKNGGSQPLVYYVFDLLHVDGWDVTGATLDDRKKLLEQIVPERKTGAIRMSDHIEGSGADVFAAACKAHLEGIICKRRDRPYSPGRGYDWLKVKCVRREEFVIGGYTPPSGAAHRVWRVVARLPQPRRRTAVRRQGRHRLRRAHTPRVAQPTASHGAKGFTVHQPQGHHWRSAARTLGRAKARRTNRVHRVDQRSTFTPSVVSRSARRQARV